LKIKFLIILVIVLLLLARCVNNSPVVASFNEKMLKIQQQYVPDKSLDIFKAQLIKENNRWILSGETTVPEVREIVKLMADSLLGQEKYENKLNLLPDSTLGDSIYGIVRVSVANLREEPSMRAELIDQVIMGHPLRLLKKDRDWYLVQTSYRYIGWIGDWSFISIDAPGMEKWRSTAKVKVCELFPLVYSLPDQNSEPVSDVVLNAILKFEKAKEGWSQVSLPDGRTGFIRTKLIASDLSIQKTPEELRKDIVKTSRSMMGIPYLWGGNSSKANDCSGFIQTVFRANGIELPRDAHQQALVGEQLVTNDSFSNVLPGDLLFFGSKDRVTHVAISLGGPLYIHQSDLVHVNSLDPSAENFSLYRRKTLKEIRKIF
jgi:uncharacterized protein YgiM (DUF1202 family)